MARSRNRSTAMQQVGRQSSTPTQRSGGAGKRQPNSTNSQASRRFSKSVAEEHGRRGARPEGGKGAKAREERAEQEQHRPARGADGTRR
eukprot:319279-Alexandrium_andersonii.AAC.1